MAQRSSTPGYLDTWFCLIYHSWGTGHFNLVELVLCLCARPLQPHAAGFPHPLASLEAGLPYADWICLRSPSSPSSRNSAIFLCLCSAATCSGASSWYRGQGQGQGRGQGLWHSKNIKHYQMFLCPSLVLRTAFGLEGAAMARDQQLDNLCVGGDQPKSPWEVFLGKGRQSQLFVHHHACDFFFAVDWAQKHI